MWTVPAAQAVYCADPDRVSECIKICPAADVCAIGLRVGTYLQCIAYFVLTLVAPDEGGAEAMWLSMAVSYAFLLTNYVQVFLGSISLHHTIVILTISSLPYVASMAGMNSLTSYRGLGKRGMLVLQIGLAVKAVLTALLWALCLAAYFDTMLAPPLHFRQSKCHSSTAFVAFFVPVRREDPNQGRATALLIAYSIFWALILIVGVYWSIKAPIVLKRNGEHLRDRPKRGYHDPKFFLTPAQREAQKEEKAQRHRDDEDHVSSSAEDDFVLMTPLRSLPKGKRHKSNILFADPIWAPSSTRPSPEQASGSWTDRQIELRHHFVIWPAVAVLMTFTILTTELQIAMNDIYDGEMHWDFPGTLTFLLTLPTVWSVFKAVLRIREGRRPKPTERISETFLEFGGHHEKRKPRRKKTGRARHTSRSSKESGQSSDSDVSARSSPSGK